MPLLKAVCIALLAYSVLPLPRCSWDNHNLRYALVALPVIGLLIGGALLLWALLCQRLGVGQALFAAGATVIPLLLSGGIHLDGFCDTVDALASQQPRERKLAILKDTHTGAFAVIYCAAYLLVCCGLYAQLYAAATLRALIVAGLIFILSRALTALTAFTLPNARGEGMLASFTRGADKRTACLISLLIALLAAAAMPLLTLWPGLLGLAMAGLTLLLYRRLALRQFGGATGDTCGFFLQVCELACLAGVVAGTLLEGAL